MPQVRTCSLALALAPCTVQNSCALASLNHARQPQSAQTLIIVKLPGGLLVTLWPQMTSNCQYLLAVDLDRMPTCQSLIDKSQLQNLIAADKQDLPPMRVSEHSGCEQQHADALSAWRLDWGLHAVLCYVGETAEEGEVCNPLDDQEFCRPANCASCKVHQTECTSL